MNKTKQLDQFFTNPKITDFLVDKLFSLFPSSKNKKFIEPSVGSGNFYNSLVKKRIDKQNIITIDIDGSNFSDKEKIIETNYLQYKIPFDKETITIGNPPFGKKGNLALEFLNKSLDESGIVAFILPKCFQRYSLQSKVKPTAKLVYELELKSNSFLVNNREYDVNSVFQIWINKGIETVVNNKRIIKRKQTKQMILKSFYIITQ